MLRCTSNCTMLLFRSVNGWHMVDEARSIIREVQWKECQRRIGHGVSWECCGDCWSTVTDCWEEWLESNGANRWPISQSKWMHKCCGINGHLCCSQGVMLGVCEIDFTIWHCLWDHSGEGPTIWLRTPVIGIILWQIRGWLERAKSDIESCNKTPEPADWGAIAWLRPGSSWGLTTFSLTAEPRIGTSAMRLWTGLMRFQMTLTTGDLIQWIRWRLERAMSDREPSDEAPKVKVEEVTWEKPFREQWPLPWQIRWSTQRVMNEEMVWEQQPHYLTTEAHSVFRWEDGLAWLVQLVWGLCWWLSNDKKRRWVKKYLIGNAWKHFEWLAIWQLSWRVTVA